MSEADPVKALREWANLCENDERADYPDRALKATEKEWRSMLEASSTDDDSGMVHMFVTARALLSAAPALLARIETGEGLRPEVRAFALAMEERLRANDHKPGWKSDRPLALLKRLFEEADELEGAVRDHEEERGGHVVRAEAADVANFALMVADVCGGLQARLGMSPQGKRKGKSGEGRK